jgi:potassium-transporting ATPase KdpC subunit
MKLFIQSVKQTFFLTILVGILYPFAITALAQIAFPRQANGSLIEVNGKIVGSELLAQQFTGDKYFWSRPSAGSYATVPSGASNFGPTSKKLQEAVVGFADTLRKAHHLPANAPVPADLVFTSASGLDPHISPEAVRFQMTRVAAARGISEDRIKTLVEKFIEPSQWGFLGELRVNVLKLNLALDKQFAK